MWPTHGKKNKRQIPYYFWLEWVEGMIQEGQTLSSTRPFIWDTAWPYPLKKSFGVYAWAGDDVITGEW